MVLQDHNGSSSEKARRRTFARVGSPPWDCPSRCRARTWPGTRCISSVRRSSLHLDFHAHPRMDAAFKKMFPFRQTRYLELAALQDSRFGDGEIFKPTRTFRCHDFSSIEVFYKAATKVRNLREGVRLAALIDYDNRGSFLDADDVGFEVPVRVRSSGDGLIKQGLESRGCSKRDVMAERRPERGIEGGRITFVQGHDLCGGLWSFLREGVRCASEHQTARE